MKKSAYDSGGFVRRQKGNTEILVKYGQDTSREKEELSV
jgi:hypothetical protein